MNDTINLVTDIVPSLNQTHVCTFGVHFATIFCRFFWTGVRCCTQFLELLDTIQIIEEIAETFCFFLIVFGLDLLGIVTDSDTIVRDSFSPCDSGVRPAAEEGLAPLALLGLCVVRRGCDDTGSRVESLGDRLGGSLGDRLGDSLGDRPGDSLGDRLGFFFIGRDRF